MPDKPTLNVTDGELDGKPQRSTAKFWKYIIVIFAFLLFVRFLMPQSTRLTSLGSSPRKHAQYRYAVIPGFFAQSSESTAFDTFNFRLQEFGLKFPPSHREDDKPTNLNDIKLKDGEKPWSAFHGYVARLNDHIRTQPGPPRKIKVLFIGRHGIGVHNVAESRYGTADWDAKWAQLPGDGNLNWTDAALTPEGERQADAAGEFWQKLVDDEGGVIPENAYVSPLGRCLETSMRVHCRMYEVFGGFRPTVKEALRETNGVHTCDKRSSRTWIREHYPQYVVEESLTENDELWDPKRRETDAEVDKRLGELLDEIFEEDERTWLSLTCHSGASGALLRVLGHRVWRLRPGEIVPIFVEATKILYE